MKTVMALLLLTVCLLLTQPISAWAQLTVHAMIKTSDSDAGSHLQQLGTGTPPLANLNINGSYPQGCTGTACVFTITARAGAGTGFATVSALDDAVDTIQLKDTVITANKAAVYGTIYFWADLKHPPVTSTGTGQKVKIVTSADGTIMRGACAARGDKIMEASGYVQDPTGAGAGDGISGSWVWIDSNSTAENKTITGPPIPPCLPGASGGFTLSDNVVFTTGLQANRIMKGYVKFYLSTAGDVLIFSASGVMLQTQVAAGGGGSEAPGPLPTDPPSCSSGQGCTPKSQLNTFCMSTYSTLKTFGCPNCISEDGMPTASGKVTLFASNNWENLEQDLARGNGEHIASLATLLNVPPIQHPAFFTIAQEQYRTLAQEGPPTPKTLVASLRSPIMTRQTVAARHSQP